MQVLLLELPPIIINGLSPAALDLLRSAENFTYSHLTLRDGAKSCALISNINLHRAEAAFRPIVRQLQWASLAITHLGRVRHDLPRLCWASFAGFCPHRLAEIVDNPACAFHQEFNTKNEIQEIIGAVAKSSPIPRSRPCAMLVVLIDSLIMQHHASTGGNLLAWQGMMEMMRSSPVFCRKMIGWLLSMTVIWWS